VKRRPTRHKAAGERVRHKYRGPVLPDDGFVQILHPVAGIRCFPFALNDALELGKSSLPVCLPVIGARISAAWQQKDAWAGHILNFERLFMTMNCLKRPVARHDMMNPMRASDHRERAGVMLDAVWFENSAVTNLLTIHIRFESSAIRERR